MPITYNVYGLQRPASSQPRRCCPSSLVRNFQIQNMNLNAFLWLCSTGRIPIKKSPKIGQTLSFLSLRTRWGFRFLPTENRKTHQISKSFTLLTKNAKSHKSKKNKNPSHFQEIVNRRFPMHKMTLGGSRVGRNGLRNWPSRGWIS